MSFRREQLESWADLARVEASFLERCLECGAVELREPEPGRLEVSPSQSAKVRRLQRICRGLDIDILAGSIIVDLVARLDELERELDADLSSRRSGDFRRP
ncbi:MAG: hypothetical protein HY925_01650 [Elusimicrobia bacterium]|nr:hypothetical protein [Elusimicrobiota bacterium]